MADIEKGLPNTKLPTAGESDVESEYRGYSPSDMKWKKEVLPITAMFLAGAFNGVNQDLLFHYQEFQSTFPNANPEF